MLSQGRQLCRRTFRVAICSRHVPETNRVVTARGLSKESSGSSLVNFYELLNVPQSFDINETQLKHNYRHLMSQHHPDKFHHQQDADSSQQDHASLVTLAYDTLKRPHTRAQHLLALETGLQMYDEHQKDMPSGESLLGIETLMEIMELREQIDRASDEGTLKRLLQDNQERIEFTSKELEAAFQAKDYDAALSLTAKMQYWNRIHETIREKMHV